jgi:hypothetical protein
LAVNWEDATWRTADETLKELGGRCGCLNIRCTDISKTRVHAAFKKVFGYSLSVDPLTHQGACVEKSDINAAHDGRVIECPVDQRAENHVYERVVNNQAGDRYVEDIRTVIMKDTVPLVYLKYRFAANRFRNYRKAVTVRAGDVFSAGERERIIAFSREMGLDLGELDILRDRGDGRLYIIDVNPTPAGPPGYMPAREYRRALKVLSAAFEATFLR